MNKQLEDFRKMPVSRTSLVAATMAAAMLMLAPVATLGAGNTPAPQSQNEPVKHVQGVVMDVKMGESMPGVAVSIWQHGKIVNGATSDLDGKFNIPAPPNGNYEVKFTVMGYKTVVLKKNEIHPNLVVNMEEDTKEMGEVVVNGFFAKNKNSFTGSVQQISSVELKQVSGTNLISALSALTPGMSMVQNNLMGSNPNQVPELVLRGMSSFSNDGQDVNQPTIILDGREISMQDLYDLDMNEVDNINILKDASATALYGSKAANGVIVITRKPIKESTLRVTYNFTGNVQFPVLRDYDLLSASEKLEYERLAGLYTAEEGAVDETTGQPLQYTLDNLYNQRYQAIRRGQYSDWLSAPARVAFSHDHSLRAYGGAGKIRYELSGRFGDTKGVMKGDYRHRYNLGFNLDYFTTEKFRISNRTTYSEVSVKDSPYGSFSLYTQMNPYDAMYNADGSVNTNLAWDLDNPLYEAQLGSYAKNGTRQLSNSTDFRWEINDEFRLTGQLDVTASSQWSEEFTSPDSRTYKNETDMTKKGSRTQMAGRGVDLGAKLVGSYNHLFEDKSLATLTAGWELNHAQSSTEKTTVLGFFNDKLNFISNAAGYAEGVPYGSQAETADVGFFTNGAYSFRDRYFADATWRMTGSSQFGANERVGHFWSAGAGWNIRNESFMKGVAKQIDVLKLRGSAGYTGKVSFSPFQAITMYEYKNTYEYKNGIGAIPKTIGNADLSWERTMTYNVGLDVSLFDRRLNFVIDAYIKQTKDLLLDKSKAPSTGVTSAKENIGELENRGIEYQLDGYIFRNQDFNWKLGTMGYINRNKITNLSSALEEMNKQNQENQGSFLTPLPQYAEGESVTALKLVRSAGIDPATGKEIYIKRNGELTFEYDANDKVYIGDTEPAFTGTVNTSVYYKGFSVYALFSIRYGAWLYNTTRVTKVEGNDPKHNADSRVFESRWKNPGDVALYKDIADSSSPQQTDRFAEKENTLTLTSLNFNYEFSDKLCQKLHLRNLRLGLNFTDLFRLSTVKIERGTTYLYSQGFEFTLNTTF